MKRTNGRQGNMKGGGSHCGSRMADCGFNPKSQIRNPKSRMGFTLVEALVSVVLLSVGIVAATATLGQMTKSEGYMQEGERMRRLADRKLQELVATGDYQFTTSGDFADLYEDRYAFTAALEPTGTEYLDALIVTVTRKDRRDDPGVDVSELIFIPPTSTGGQGQ